MNDFVLYVASELFIKIKIQHENWADELVADKAINAATVFAEKIKEL